MNEIMVSPALVQIQDRMWMSVSMIFSFICVAPEGFIRYNENGVHLVLFRI